MARKNSVPNYSELITVTYAALKALGGSGKNDVFITTGSFSKAAVEEAAAPGKQQIDLIDGEEFITKLAEFGIGVKEVKDYDIDEEFFAKL